MPWRLKAIRSFVLQVEQAKKIYTLFVADGWDQGRFVNFYYTRYTDTYGVAFSR